MTAEGSTQRTKLLADLKTLLSYIPEEVKDDTTYYASNRIYEFIDHHASDEEQEFCDRHGGLWGDDMTCARCTYEDGTPRPVTDPGPLPDEPTE